MIIAESPHDLAPALAKALDCYRNIGVQSHNAAVYMPPIDEQGHYVAWLVDRGDLRARTSDIGGWNSTQKRPWSRQTPSA